MKGCRCLGGQFMKCLYMKYHEWDCSKNPHCHSERSEESHVFLFKSKNQKRDPSAFSLSMTQRGKLARILEHSYSAAGEKSLTFLLLIFRKGNPSDQSPQDSEKTYQWCHSERSEESTTFTEFLARRIYKLSCYFLLLTFVAACKNQHRHSVVGKKSLSF